MYVLVQNFFRYSSLTDVGNSMAGSETTSQTLGYAVWELAKNQDKQLLLRDEILSFSTELTYDDIQSKMPYLDGVTREVWVSSIHSVISAPKFISLNIFLASAYTQPHLTWNETQ